MCRCPPTGVFGEERSDDLGVRKSARDHSRSPADRRDRPPDRGRLGAPDSAFGRQFDSLAAIVSFGVAPALLVYRIVLQEFRTACWIIALVYLCCGALRLARFNTAAANHEKRPTNHSDKNFTGFPIPAAAGLIASITLFLLWLAEGEHQLGKWKFVLPPLLVFLSFMMFSRFQYPSFTAINWKTKKSIRHFLAIILGLIFTVLN